MTLVLGVKTPQGAILAADTQETYVGSHKVNHPKLVYKKDTTLAGIPLALAVAGAGIGPWIDKLTTTMWDSVQSATNLDEACSEIERAIKEQYRDFRDLLTFDVTAELIYAVGANGAVRLFYAYGAIVNEECKKASGSGQPIADFLLRNVDKETHITNVMSFAIYTLMSAKRHADGCGGETQVALIHNNGFSTELNSEQIKAIEGVLDVASLVGDRLVMIAGNTVYDTRQLQLAAMAMTESLAAELSKLHQLDSITKLLDAIEYPRPKFTLRDLATNATDPISKLNLPDVAPKQT